MAPVKHSLVSLAALLCALPVTSALTEQVLGTVIYTNHGDRTPLALANSPNLTPLGAQQLYRAGSNMRRRYVTPVNDPDEPSFVVKGISSIFLDNSQINTLLSTDEFVTGSATAFMQGLYPPLQVGQSYSNFNEANLANGTSVVAPLDGYQYPNIKTASLNDLRSIFVKGTVNCPAYDRAVYQYYNSSSYQGLQQKYQPFYDSLKEPLLRGVFPDSSVGYFDAYYIWDYLNYGIIHNKTVDVNLSEEDRVTAQALALDWMFDLYANSTTDGKVGPEHIRAIAGRTFAMYVTRALGNIVHYEGRLNKMNLVFGDYMPMMSFMALSQLMTTRTGSFINIPAPGSSMIFELYTFQNTNAAEGFPSTSEMFVRFLYQNGTDDDASLVEYSLFGQSPSQQMTYSDFMSSMSGIALSGVEDWCTTCGSGAVFCPAFVDSDQSGSSSPASRHGLKPAVAGVIGAIAALAFMGIVVAAVMLIAGVRFYRRPNKRASELGGFKGTEKLASDRDLTIPKGGAGATVTETENRGHERVGSWELKEPAKPQPFGAGIDTEAFGNGWHNAERDDTHVDPYGVPVKPRDGF